MYIILKYIEVSYIIYGIFCFLLLFKVSLLLILKLNYNCWMKDVIKIVCNIKDIGSFFLYCFNNVYVFIFLIKDCLYIFMEFYFFKIFFLNELFKNLIKFVF